MVERPKLLRLIEIGLKATKAQILMFRWSMKKDRELIRLARSGVSVDQISARLKHSPATILKVAKRLGIYLGPKRDGKLKAKGK